MAQNITIAGATYSDVPQINIPKAGGGTAVFPDTSGDSVTPETLVTGTTAHDKSGVIITGTNPYEKTATDNEVSSQTALITKIQAALEGKAAGSGGGGNGLLIGQNLADPNGIIANYYIQNGTEKAYIGWSISSFIPVDPAKLYSITPFGIIGGTNLQYCEFYNMKEMYIRSITVADFTGDKIVALSPPDGAAYMRLSFNTTDIQNCKVYVVNEESAINNG